MRKPRPVVDSRGGVCEQSADIDRASGFMTGSLQFKQEIRYSGDQL